MEASEIKIFNVVENARGKSFVTQMKTFGGRNPVDREPRKRCGRLGKERAGECPVCCEDMKVIALANKIFGDFAPSMSADPAEWVKIESDKADLGIHFIFLWRNS